MLSSILSETGSGILYSVGDSFFCISIARRSCLFAADHGIVLIQAAFPPHDSSLLYFRVMVLLYSGLNK